MGAAEIVVLGDYPTLGPLPPHGPPGAYKARARRREASSAARRNCRSRRWRRCAWKGRARAGRINALRAGGASIRGGGADAPPPRSARAGGSVPVWRCRRKYWSHRRSWGCRWCAGTRARARPLSHPAREPLPSLRRTLRARLPCVRSLPGSLVAAARRGRPLVAVEAWTTSILRGRCGFLAASRTNETPQARLHLICRDD